MTGAFSSHRKFLGDKEYGEALDCLVKACSDLLLQSPDGQRIFIGKRLVHPQPDWWFVGGRIFPGETPVQSCCRLLRRELALEIEPARFQTVYCQSLNLALTLALTLALSLSLALTLTLTLTRWRASTRAHSTRRGTGLRRLVSRRAEWVSACDASSQPARLLSGALLHPPAVPTVVRAAPVV